MTIHQLARYIICIDQRYGQLFTNCPRLHRSFCTPSIMELYLRLLMRVRLSYIYTSCSVQDTTRS
jgi:hypothetical protein